VLGEEVDEDLKVDLNPSELDFLARISGARVDNRPFRQEENSTQFGHSRDLTWETRCLPEVSVPRCFSQNVVYST
jgi:hypothetical protein